MSNLEKQAQIDAALAAALEELDDDDENEHEAGEPSNEQRQSPAKALDREANLAPNGLRSDQGVGSSPPSADEGDPEKILASLMDHLEKVHQEFGGEGSNHLFGELMREIQVQLESESRSNQPAEKPSASGNAPTPRPTNEVDRAISTLVEDMARQSSIDPPLHEDSGDGSEQEDLLKHIMEGLQGGGADLNADSLIDGMMEQLLSKELMYEPMKEVAMKFPSWLERNKHSLSDKEYEERRKQCMCFQELIQTYDSDPNNVTKLMTLMQDAQEYGQPPSEIIQEIAPGLELDENGIPKLDGMGRPGNGDDCRIM